MQGGAVHFELAIEIFTLAVRLKLKPLWTTTTRSLRIYATSSKNPLAIPVRVPVSGPGLNTIYIYIYI